MTKFKQAIFISYDGMTDPLGQSQVLPYISHLSKNGYKFHLISCEKSQNFSKYKNNISEICSNNNISWHPIRYSGSIPIVSSIINLQRIKKETLKINKLHNIQIIHCRSYIPAFIGLYFKRKFGTKFVFDMRGFWADERVDGKVWNIKKAPFKQVYKFFKKKEIEFIQEADHIISLTENAKEIIHSWEHINNNPVNITVIPCCADLNLFNYQKVKIQSKNSFKKQLNLKDNDFVISYLGSIGTWYLLNEMLDFFNELKKSKPNTKFLFISKDNPSLITEKAANKGIKKNDIIVISAERNELPNLLALSDISIFFIMPTYSKRASSPTKKAELLGMGIPIICNSNIGDTDKIIEQQNCGLVIKQFNNQEYINAIDKIDTITTITKKHLFDTANKHFSLEKGGDSYLKVYNDLLNN